MTGTTARKRAPSDQPSRSGAVVVPTPTDRHPFRIEDFVSNPPRRATPIRSALSISSILRQSDWLPTFPLTLSLTNVLAAAALILVQALLSPTANSVSVQILLDLSWIAAIIAVVMTLDRAMASVLEWDARHHFHWNRSSVRLYWFLGALTLWCGFAWSLLFGGSLILGGPAEELLNGFVTDFVAGLTGVLLLIAVYALLWTAYRSNMEPPWIVDHGYWHVRLNTLLDVFVAGTTVVIGVGGVFLGLYAGLGIDPDPERRDAGNVGALTAVTILLLVIALRTWHKYYRESEVRAELRHLRLSLSDSAHQLRVSADALRASNLLHSRVLRTMRDPAGDRTDPNPVHIGNHEQKR